jgi:dTDP-4-amino-4,6-dideoxygalactose transaminase
MKVPFLDLQAHHEPIREQLDAAIGAVIDAGAFAGGPFVAKFEKEFAGYCGAADAVGVGNGTDALWFALLALGVGPNDEVITVPSTFMATVEAISQCGARPVFVDIDEATYTMDPGLLERAVTPRTKAVIPVHLFGQCADMDPILRIAGARRIPVIEDACQAHGAVYKGRKAGAMGVAGCFSFYPGKNLGALGEAGAIVTSDAELAGRMRVLRDHGQARKYQHSHIGWNGRMDGIQGAVLSVKLKLLDVSNLRRRSHALLYDQLLGGNPEVIVPAQACEGQSVYHIYAVRVKDRDQVLQSLAEKGISCGIHYPIPVHLQEAYRFLGRGRGSFPVAERCAGEFLSLPMFPELTREQVHAVAEELKLSLSAAKPQAACAR